LIDPTNRSHPRCAFLMYKIHIMMIYMYVCICQIVPLCGNVYVYKYVLILNICIPPIYKTHCNDTYIHVSYMYHYNAFFKNTHVFIRQIVSGCGNVYVYKYVLILNMRIPHVQNTHQDDIYVCMYMSNCAMMWECVCV